MIYHFTFDWPQIVVTFFVFLSFVRDCIKGAKRETPLETFVFIVIGFLWMIGTLYSLSTGGFYGR